MAEKRFTRLGWKNVKVICQDARKFRLHEHEQEARTRKELILKGQIVRDLDENADAGGAELVTMSYALSMVPEFYPVIDSISSLLSPNGVVGVVDFYVQNQIDFISRNYTGGVIDRHVMWISRVFWRTWFEIDRVNLEAARRVRTVSLIVLFHKAHSSRTIWNTASARFSASTPATTSLASNSPTTYGLAVLKRLARRLPNSPKSMPQQPSPPISPP